MDTTSKGSWIRDLSKNFTPLGRTGARGTLPVFFSADGRSALHAFAASSLAVSGHEEEAELARAAQATLEIAQVRRGCEGFSISHRRMGMALFDSLNQTCVTAMVDRISLFRRLHPASFCVICTQSRSRSGFGKRSCTTHLGVYGGSYSFKQGQGTWEKHSIITPARSQIFPFTYQTGTSLGKCSAAYRTCYRCACQPSEGENSYSLVL